MKTFDKNYLNRNREGIAHKVALRLLDPCEVPFHVSELEAPKSTPKLRLLKGGRKVALASIVAVMCSACSTTGINSILQDAEKGQFIIAGDEKGGQALFDGLTGLVVTGKADPHQDNTHHELRRGQEQGRTVRYQAGFASRKKSGGN